MIREKFVRHVHNMFKIMGYDDIKAKAAGNLMKLETEMASHRGKKKIYATRLKITIKLPLSNLRHDSQFRLAGFMDDAGLHNVDSVIVGQPEFLTALNGYLNHSLIEDWKNYLKFHYFQRLAPYMDDKTFMESFSFYSTVLRGVKEPKPRWKRAVEQTNLRWAN